MARRVTRAMVAITEAEMRKAIRCLKRRDAMGLSPGPGSVSWEASCVLLCALLVLSWASSANGLYPDGLLLMDDFAVDSFGPESCGNGNVPYCWTEALTGFKLSVSLPSGRLGRPAIRCY